MATVTGRTGIMDHNLFYVKGGYAGVSGRLVDTALPTPSPAPASTPWHNGWTVGAGLEYGPTHNWIVGLEYDYASLSRPGPINWAGNAAPLVYTFDAKPRDIQSVVARVSDKFNAPLISRY